MTPRVQTVICWLAVLVVLAAIPGAFIDTYENGRVYLFSMQFLRELPERFTGEGRLRFIIQPLVASLLGIGSGIADARAGAPPYIFELLLNARSRGERLRHGLAQIRTLLALGIILDVIFQLGLYGEVHPGPAVLIGPILISIPYAIARALTNRIGRRWMTARPGP
jgi:hypothetical protein